MIDVLKHRNALAFDIFSYFSTNVLHKTVYQICFKAVQNQSYTSNQSKVVSDGIDKDAAGSDHCTFKHLP